MQIFYEGYIRVLKVEIELLAMEEQMELRIAETGRGRDRKKRRSVSSLASISDSVRVSILSQLKLFY